MKSPIWMLTFLLPLLTELAVASPAAEPEADSLDSGQEFEERDLENRQSNQGFCRAKRQYSYWKYPCDSSDRTGRANRGDQFSASCKYKNWYKTPKGWVRDTDKPLGCRGNWDHPC